MEYSFSDYQASAQALKERIGGFTPEVLLILGSGLGSLGEQVEQLLVVPYAQVPHLRRSTAPDHKGQLSWAAVRAACGGDAGAAALL